ncbi:helix-turn-helix transcriptional regulator [Halobacillus sp. SY10]|uniref:XRE family transcriptional regulator n=1 Tax=Halobacillus trueperi TaxID=156205 RepID=A0A3D8VT74_9BACI|nr:XRE family transcriptional regulator [Halobacillus trueperi]
MIDSHPCQGYGADFLRLRESKSMSKEQVAFLLGEDVRFIERLESEKIYPSSYLMNKISEVFQMDIKVVSGRIWCKSPSECSKWV